MDDQAAWRRPAPALDRAGLSRQEKMAFVVGAPRCGTTTLARVLAQHPDVCFSSIKEPHFFSRSDLRPLDDAALGELVQRDYVERFFGRCDGRRVRAEASPSYLYTPERVTPILKLWPDARFIVALRDPLAMVPSLHSRLLVTGDETVKDFAKAWALVPERSAGRRIPRSCIDPQLLRYDRAAAFGTHVGRFFDAVGRERCLVVLLDDLKDRPWPTYEKVCAFLGLEPRPGTELHPRREHKAARFHWVQRLLNRPPKAVQTVVAGENFLQRDGRSAPNTGLVGAIFALRKRILKWNEIPAKRQPLDPSVRDEIIGHYRPEVERLSVLIGRDLSHWLRAE
jgi:hypothetical protein